MMSLLTTGKKIAGIRRTRRRKSLARPARRSRRVDGRCPKCTTIVKFNVAGPVGDEIYECTGCMSKFHIDEL
ncbi:MAG: hypothetical protein ACREBU_03830 [Nitrososphaera sp.]